MLGVAMQTVSAASSAMWAETMHTPQFDSSERHAHDYGKRRES